MFAHTGEHPPELAEGPPRFHHFPGIPFHYGAPSGKTRAQAYVCFRGEWVTHYCESGLLELRETQLFRQLRNPEAFFRTMRSLHQLLKIPGRFLMSGRSCCSTRNNRRFLDGSIPVT